MVKKNVNCGKAIAFALYAVLAVMAVSCSKNEQKAGDEPDEPGTIVPGEIAKIQFTANFVDTFVESKASLSDFVPVWQEGDAINLFDPEGISRDLELKSFDGNSAVFEGDAEMAGPYAAIYPKFDDAAYQDGK